MGVTIPPAAASARRRLCSLVRLGLLLAAVLMLVGFVVGAIAGIRLASEETGRYAALRLDSVGWLLTVGMLLLVVSPALQVLGLAAVWVRERDWKYVAVALLVLSTLGVAVVLGSR
jgi:hypothetical protein